MKTSNSLGLVAAVFAVFGCLNALPARAQFLFPGNGGGYLTPDLGSNADDYSAWDVFYAAYGTPNKPDISAPYGSYQLASVAGVTAPAQPPSPLAWSPGNPGAFWDSRNPTITQVGTSTAFIIGPATTGNIYSFSNPLSYQVSDSTPYNDGLVLFQFQTEGTAVNFSSIQLQYMNSSGTLVSLSPSQYLTEYQAASVNGQGFSVTNRNALEWNLTGLDVNSFTIVFSSLAPSMSLQTANMDTSPAYVSTVPQARTWTSSGSGLAWSNAGNWAEGSSSVENGNVFFNPSGSADINLDANHTVGQMIFESPGNVTISSTNGSFLTANTGINTTATATGTYSLNVNYAFGDYNVFDIEAGTVKLNGVVSGNNGFFKQGEGALELNGNNTFTGGVGVEGGTLVMSGTNVYSGGTSVLWGKLVVKGDALNGTPGALGNDSTTISLGADSSLYAYQDVPDPAAMVIDGDHTIARNIQMAGGTFEKDLGAEGTTNGATYSGAISLNTSTNVHLNAVHAGDQVTFSGGITGGTAPSSASGITSQVVMDGQGTVVFAGNSNSYANDTVVNSGTLRVASGGSLTSNGAVTVNMGAKLMVDGTLVGNGGLSLYGTLGGSGTVNRGFDVYGTAILNPGEGTGVLTTASETWDNGGTLKFNLEDAAGTAGIGWNLLQINGSLDVAASAFHLDLTSLGLDNQAGLAQNFDPTKDYSWEIASATNGISRFNVGDLTVDESEFANSYNGIFSVTQEGNDIFLNYEAVPEPSTCFLLACGLVGLGMARRFLRREVISPGLAHQRLPWVHRKTGATL